MTAASRDHALATWAAELDASTLPDAIVVETQGLLLDAIASALAGARAEERPTVAALAHDLFGSGRSTVVAGASLAPLGAVFLNGFQVTAATICDVHRPTMTHVSPEVVPVVLAAAQATGASGRDVLAAMAIGVETTLRVALALDDEAYRARRWHNPGVAGPFGAAAAAGRLLGLDGDAMAIAFGHAGGQAAGTFVALATAGVKVHQARGALSGLLAATLAQRGLDASRYALTDPAGGLLTTYADGGDPSQLTDGLGTTWHGAELSLRRWPGSSSVQTLIEASLAVASATGAGGAKAIRPVRVEVALPPRSYAMASAAGWADQLSAMQAPAYVAAAILHDGAWSLDQVHPDRLGDPTIDAFARGAVTVRPDEALPPAGARLTVELADGRRLVENREEPLGAPGRPLGSDDRQGKLRDAATALGWASRVGPILAAVASLDGAPSIHHLLDLLADPERDARS